MSSYPALNGELEKALFALLGVRLAADDNIDEDREHRTVEAMTSALQELF